MNQDQLNIDGLFEQARSVKPEVTYEQTEKAFFRATLLAAGGVLATKGVLKLLSTKKWLIMFSAITTISTASVIAVAAYSSDIKESTISENNTPSPSESYIPIPKEENDLTTKNIVYVPNAPAEVTDINKVAIPEIELLDPMMSLFDSPEFKKVMSPCLDDSTAAEIISSDETIRAYSERFEINAETTMEDLEALKQAAEGAGIKLSYTAKIKNNKLMKISLHAEIKTRNNHQNMTINSDDIGKGDDEIIFGWFTDKSGKADEMGFGEPMNNTSTGCCSGGKNKHGCNETKDDFFDEGSYLTPKVYEFLGGLEDENAELVEHLEGILEEMEEELAYINDELLADIENINMERTNLLINTMSGENEALLQDLEIELNQLFEEIQIELRDKKEAIEFEKEKEKRKEKENK